MAGEVVARNYASALFELAERDGKLEAFGEGLEAVVRMLEEVPGFRLFLETPGIARPEKKKVLREALQGRVPDPVLNFVLLVLDKRRQRLLGAMNREYQSLVDAALGRAHVEVTVARALDEAGVAAVTERLSKILGTQVIPHLRVNPDLVGGIVFRSGDVVYDGSVRRRLEQMKRRLMAAHV